MVIHAVYYICFYDLSIAAMAATATDAEGSASAIAPAAPAAPALVQVDPLAILLLYTPIHL